MARQVASELDAARLPEQTLREPKLVLGVGARVVLRGMVVTVLAADAGGPTPRQAPTSGPSLQVRARRSLGSSLVVLFPRYPLGWRHTPGVISAAVQCKLIHSL
jgi:hypothetical protein